MSKGKKDKRKMERKQKKVKKKIKAYEIIFI